MYQSNCKSMFEWLIVLSYHFIVFGSVKNDVYKTFGRWRIEWWRKLSIRMFSKLWHCGIISYLISGFKTIILWPVHPKWFLKYAFSAKIWFVKTSTRMCEVIIECPKSKCRLGNAMIVQCRLTFVLSVMRNDNNLLILLKPWY